MAAFGILAVSRGLPDLAFSYYSDELISLVRAALLEAEASALIASKSESVHSSIAIVNHPTCDYDTLEPNALLRAFTTHPRIGLLQLGQFAERIPQVSFQQLRYLRVSAGPTNTLHMAVFQESNSLGNMDHGYTVFVLSNDRYCTPQRICAQFECFLLFVGLLYGPFWEEFLIVPSSSLRRIAVSGTPAERSRALLFFQTLFDYYRRATVFPIETLVLPPNPAPAPPPLTPNPPNPLLPPEELAFSPATLLGGLELLYVGSEILRTSCLLLERLHPLLEVLASPSTPPTLRTCSQPSRNSARTSSGDAPSAGAASAGAPRTRPASKGRSSPPRANSRDRRNATRCTRCSSSATSSWRSTLGAPPATSSTCASTRSTCSRRWRGWFSSTRSTKARGRGPRPNRYTATRPTACP